jgi:hypothetical protein
MLNTYYSRELKSWVAYYTDRIGQLGDAQYGESKEAAAFALGLELGRKPECFSRPLSVLLGDAA